MKHRVHGGVNWVATISSWKACMFIKITTRSVRCTYSPDIVWYGHWNCSWLVRVLKVPVKPGLLFLTFMFCRSCHIYCSLAYCFSIRVMLTHTHLSSESMPHRVKGATDEFSRASFLLVNKNVLFKLASKDLSYNKRPPLNRLPESFHYFTV